MQIVDLERILDEFGWSKRELAERVKVHPVTISRWKEVPGPVAAYLELRLEMLKVLGK